MRRRSSAGRAAQLPITDNTVSRRHAELIPADGAWILHDLGSANGSYVNGTRVENRYILKLGDQIRVGRTLMVFGSQPGDQPVQRRQRVAERRRGRDGQLDHAYRGFE